MQLLIFLLALLYSSVGHGGASGYLAAMAFMGFASNPDFMRAAALILNVFVSALGVWNYSRAKQVDWRLLCCFIISSIPAAYCGARLHLPLYIYQPLIGTVLLLSAVQILVRIRWAAADDAKTHPPPIFVAIISGIALGFLAGLSGIGGGIFLSPLMLLMHWAPTRMVSGTAAAFILVNSLAGIAGLGSGAVELMAQWSFLVWIAAALSGAIIGTWFGTKILPIQGLRSVLAMILVIAGGKMLFL